MNFRPGRHRSTSSERGSIRGRIFFLLGAFAAVTAGVLAGLLVYLRSEAITSGEELLSAFAQLTEVQTAHALQDLQQSLAILGDKLAVRADSTGEKSFNAELLALRASRPFLRAIAVLDSRGRTVGESERLGPSLDLSDEAYFAHSRDNSGLLFLVGAAVRDRATGEWIIPATQILRRTDGAYAGVIVAALDPLLLKRVWTTEKSVAGGTTTLWAGDGMMLTRSPFDERAMGVSGFSEGLAARTRGGSVAGIYQTVSRIDDKERLVAYRRFLAYPNLILTVTQPMDFVLAVWGRIVWIVAAAWVMAAAALTGLAIWLVREWDKRRAMEDRYRILFDASPQPLLVADRETLRFLAVNDATVAQYGWSREEQLAMTADDLYLPQDVQAATALRQQYGFGTSRTIAGLRHHKKDGTVIDVETSVRLIDFEGRPAFLAMAQDVTARHAVEEQLRQAQKMEVVGQLTGGIAHDFNNILFVILANTDALLEMENRDASDKNRLDQIEKAAQRAADLTRQLLAFSRKQPLRPQQTDLNDLVTETGKLLHRTLGAQIEIESVLADDLCIVEVDRSQFQIALVNLSLNARDAMPGGGRLLIETHNATLGDECDALNPEATPGAYAMLAVTDVGSGIPPNALTKVFEPFFTTKEVGKGTGLGLSMVYGFIKQSKGYVRICSEVGRGTTIKLYLPCTCGTAEAALVRNKVTIPGGIERILVVEDEPLVRASVVRQLQSLGYTVSEASNGEDGIAAFVVASPPYDLLLTDVVMPGLLAGKALAAEVARRWPKTKIVFMSGYTETASVQHGRLDEGALLLSKPFRKLDLAMIIRHALDGAGASATVA